MRNYLKLLPVLIECNGLPEDLRRKQSRKKLTTEQVIPRISRWCAIQDRSTREVVAKMKMYGVQPEDENQILKFLAEGNFLNEKRFAENFTRGKFRIKKWGKLKIAGQLREKGVSEEYILSSLSALDEGEYCTTLKRLAEIKWLRTQGTVIQRKEKTCRYLFSKGYEWPDIQGVLKNLE